MKITFIGAGVFGTALANIAKYNHHEIKFYDPIKFPEITLQDALRDAEVVVYVAPTDQASKILPQLNSEIPLICASKGFLSIAPFAKFRDFSVLSGAGFAEDVEAAIQSNTTQSTAAPNATQPSITFTVTSKLAQDIFSTGNIKTELISDTLGVLLCGTLKNIYAIGAGLTSDTLKSYLNSATKEFAQILSANHASPNTLQYSCGLADLILTCSPRSRNFRFGCSLKLNKQPESNVVEGVSAIQAIQKTPDFILPEDAAIIRHIVRTVQQNMPHLDA